MSRGDTPGEGPWWHVYTAEWCGCILTVSCQADTLISHPGLFASETGHQYRHLWCLGLCVPYVCDKVQKTTVVNLQSLQWVFLLLPHHTVLLLKLLQLGRRHLQQRPTPADDNTRQKSLQTPRQMNKHTQTTTLNGTQYACNNTFLVKKNTNICHLHRDGYLQQLSRSVLGLVLFRKLYTKVLEYSLKVNGKQVTTRALCKQQINNDHSFSAL